MTFNCALSIADIIGALSLLGGVVVFLFAYFQWRQNNTTHHAEYIHQLIEKFWSDDDIKKEYYTAEYEDFEYSSSFHRSEHELCLDKTLTYFSYICYLKEKKIITDEEFYFFEYKIKHMLSGEGVKNYLFNIHHFSEKQKAKCTFHYLIKFGAEEKLIDSDFYNKDSERYKYVLN